MMLAPAKECTGMKHDLGTHRRDLSGGIIKGRIVGLGVIPGMYGAITVYGGCRAAFGTATAWR